MIPLVDLEAQYLQIKEEIDEVIRDVVKSRAFIQGRYVAAFETEFARVHQCGHVVGCSNGTSALFLALLAAGIKAGDEVITTPATFIATAEAICHVGAVPVFVDIDPETYTIDPSLIEARITPKTRAILPVHLYGNPADMDRIMSLAKAYDLRVIEDCAQAHLATYNSRPVGTFGDAGAFSFYPGKNLGAYGDAGAVITSDPERAKTMRLLADHGRDSKYIHTIIGYNHRMDGLQAGILLVKLKHLERWTGQRRSNARLYSSLLHGVEELQLPVSRELAEHAYHLYVVQVPDRDAVLSYLQENGVSAAIHYPIPLHLQPALKHLGYREGDFPVAEHSARHVVSLPMYPELTPEQIEGVCSLLAAAVKNEG
jgi:dTDP-4-amino-4,6-dideoxygalactose transaminase